MTKEPGGIFEDEEINAAFICSPTSTHADLIKKAAQYKKHVFCEKTISFSDEETLETYKQIVEAGVKFQVGFNRRFDKKFAEMKGRVEGSKISNLHLLKITSRDPGSPNPEYIGLLGGVCMDMTIHDFDMCRYLAGSEVVEVFANGALGVIDNSREAVYGYEQRIEVFGNGGALVTDNEGPTNLKYYHANAVETDKPFNFFLERYNDSFITETEQFVQCIFRRC